MPCCRKEKALQLPEPEAVGPIKALTTYYEAKVVPAEKRHQFPLFYTPQYSSSELEGKPIVMLLGQYSVGKTSMIEYLLGGCYPGAEIGPEPTTDFFAHVQYSDQPVTIEGPTLITDKTYPLKGLEGFGNGFLTKLRSTNFKADLLKYMSILDTPGILSGQKQTDSRGYNFAEVVRFLADRVDKIILMFDAGKVDISDEYKNVIQGLDGHNEKVLIVLNKSDSVPPTELIRVRGALMWNLGKILSAPEVPKVYIGSFWKFCPAKNSVNETITEDADAMIKEICELVNTYRSKRVNDVVKRAKMVRTHCLIMDAALRKKGTFDSVAKMLTPKFMMGVFANVEKENRIVHEDMPNVENFCKRARKSEPKAWNKIDKKVERLLLQFLNDDISKIIVSIKQEPQVDIDYRPAKLIEKAPDGGKSRTEESYKKREKSDRQNTDRDRSDRKKSSRRKKTSRDRKSSSTKEKTSGANTSMIPSTNKPVMPPKKEDRLERKSETRKSERNSEAQKSNDKSAKKSEGSKEGKSEEKKL